MSNWKVSREKIEMFTHGNADSLSLGKVGSYQVVVQKGLYVDGDVVVFAPEKSVLTGQIKTEFEKYLVGPDNDRVKGVRLRNEISSGILIPKHLWENVDGVSDAEIGEDVSELLGITHYEPPIPTQLAGKVRSFDMDHIGTHDCEQVGVYANDLVDGERVVVTEKVHGCCDENTILTTEDGDMTIKKICDSKYTGNVLSFDIENDSIEFDKVTNHDIKENIDNWYSVELEDGTVLKLTDNHRVYLPDLNCYRSVSDIVVGDNLLKR
jgi:RNA ligase (TIGR02306 family)